MCNKHGRNRCAFYICWRQKSHVQSENWSSPNPIGAHQQTVLWLSRQYRDITVLVPQSCIQKGKLPAWGLYARLSFLLMFIKHSSILSNPRRDLASANPHVDYAGSVTVPLCLDTAFFSYSVFCLNSCQQHNTPSVINVFLLLWGIHIKSSHASLLGPMSCESFLPTIISGDLKAKTCPKEHHHMMRCINIQLCYSLKQVTLLSIAIR